MVNLVGAMAMAAFLGVPYDDMWVQLRKLTPPPHRLQLIKKGNAVIIDDAYNSNPKGCEAALKTLSLFDGYKILVTPGMIELGQKQYELNREFGAKAAGVCDFVILVGERQTKPIYDGLISAGCDGAKYVAILSTIALQKAYSSGPTGKRSYCLKTIFPITIER